MVNGSAPIKQIELVDKLDFDRYFFFPNLCGRENRLNEVEMSEGSEVERREGLLEDSNALHKTLNKDKTEGKGT